MRLKNSLKNIYIGVATQIIITLLGFISRRIFLDSLGSDYLGLNGLLTNVLSMLSLVEGGIGASIVYNLYKPLAEGDENEVIALVQLYKKLYGIIAILVGVLSLGLYPLLNVLIDDSATIPFLGLVYFIFIFKNMLSYLNAHKWSLINADQKGYIIARYNLLFNVITTIIKIFVLKLTANYVLFLVLELVVFGIQNIWNGRIVNRLYPYIKTKNKYNVNPHLKKELFKNVKAMFLHNIGGYCVFGTDNLLISALVNLKSVGLYSNYTMVINQLIGILKPILSGADASIGNLIATESEDKTCEIFNISYLLNFWIYGFVTIVLYNLLEPFINFWLGEGLLLDSFTFLIILLNFYISGMRSSIISFKTKAGIFSNDQYLPLIESVINLGGSIIFAKYYGLVGIFLGTTLSTLLIPFWVQPKLVYNYVFKRNVTEYFIKYFKYLSIMIISGFITTYLCNLVTIKLLFVSLVVKGIICTFCINICFSLFLSSTVELKYLIKIVTTILSDKFNIKKLSFIKS